MGYVKEYENEVIEIWGCDTCTHHCIVRNKVTGTQEEITNPNHFNNKEGKIKPLNMGFISYINQKCSVDEKSGNLICNNCGNEVIPDFFEKTLHCQGCDEI